MTTNTVDILDADGAAPGPPVWRYVSITAWDLKGTYLVLTDADRTVRLIPLDPSWQVVITPDDAPAPTED